MSLREIIYQKEVALLSNENRSSSKFIENTLTPDFKEFGSSGNIHRLDDVIKWLKNENAFQFEISNFEIESLSDHTVLATYKIQINNSFSLRSSIWILSDNNWKMKFHQGTRTQSFK